MNKFVVEFIGTFFLVLTVCMTVLGGAGNFAPIAIGFMLVVMVYAGAHVSGAHYNPAVTVSVFLRKKVDESDVAGYMISQVAAAVAAAMVAAALLPAVGADLGVAAPRDIVPSLLSEFLGTFALCYVILNVATAKATAGNQYFGIAIGCTVMVCSYAFGGISGGAFNPAVAVGMAKAGMLHWTDLWLYVSVEVIAGMIAATIFRLTTEEED